MKKIITLCSCFLCILTLYACKDTSLTKYSAQATDLGFDTVVSFVAYTENENLFNTYFEQFKQEFKRYDQLFDRYDNVDGIHNIKTINDNAGIGPVEVDEAIIELLELSKTYDTLSNHKFDITLGSMLDIWHRYRDESTLRNSEGKPGIIPSSDELQQAKRDDGWEHIIIDKEKSSVYIDDAAISIDVGGVAKGFAVEKIAQSLEDAGLQHAIINGGGNVRIIGDKPEAAYWSVGVQIPNFDALSTDSLLSIKIADSSSFVTSGDYQRYYEVDGQLMHHIIDPATLYPARHCRSVTVVTQDSGIADILSTTLFTMSHQEGVSFLTKLREEQGIVADAVWVYDKSQPLEDDSEYLDVKGYQIVVSDGLKDSVLTD